MRAQIFGVTIHQPWAWCIGAGHKPIENRKWEPPANMCPVGTWLAIHAGKTYDLDGALDIYEQFRLEIPPELPLGAVVAVARFGGVVTASESRWFTGPVGWLLKDVLMLPEPVPCRGLKNLWPLPLGVLEKVRAGWAAAKGMRRQTQTSRPDYPWDNQ